MPGSIVLAHAMMILFRFGFLHEFAAEKKANLTGSLSIKR
jgi:hypothetical protein